MITGKSQDTWRLNNIPLNNAWVREEITKEIWKQFDLNVNVNTTEQHLWNAMKAVTKENFITWNAHTRK